MAGGHFMLMLKGSSQPYYSRVGNKRGNKLQKTLQVSSNLKKKSVISLRLSLASFGSHLADQNSFPQGWLSHRPWGYMLFGGVIAWTVCGMDESGSVPQFPHLYNGASNICQAHYASPLSLLPQELALLPVKFSVYFLVNLTKHSREPVFLTHQSCHSATCLATVDS